MKERIERVVQVAKERDELKTGTAWWELMMDLKRYATQEEKDMIDDTWFRAERDEYLPKWDERFLEAISGDYKTQAEIALEQQMHLHKLHQQANQAMQVSQQQLNQSIAQAQNQPNPYQNAGLFNGLKGLLGGK